uniref:Uncharacterized protein n=1 Tax=Arundo donax TaxID=35708 RepID=A0A0A9E202_ARUDO
MCETLLKVFYFLFLFFISCHRLNCGHISKLQLLGCDCQLLLKCVDLLLL